MQWITSKKKKKIPSPQKDETIFDKWSTSYIKFCQKYIKIVSSEKKKSEYVLWIAESKDEKSLCYDIQMILFFLFDRNFNIIKFIMLLFYYRVIPRITIYSRITTHLTTATKESQWLSPSNCLKIKGIDLEPIKNKVCKFERREKHV